MRENRDKIIVHREHIQHKEELCQVHIDKKELSLISNKMYLSLITNRLSKTWDNYLKNY